MKKDNNKYQVKLFKFIKIVKAIDTSVDLTIT